MAKFFKTVLYIFIGIIVLNVFVGFTIGLLKLLAKVFFALVIIGFIGKIFQKNN